MTFDVTQGTEQNFIFNSSCGLIRSLRVFQELVKVKIASRGEGKTVSDHTN
jgi:hypothetical protein